MKIEWFFFHFQEGGNVADILQFVEVYLWSPDQCNAAFEDLGAQLDPIAEICAYDEVKTSTCRKISAHNVFPHSLAQNIVSSAQHGKLWH